jgi:predicted membrane-bound spermidine synthase
MVIGVLWLGARDRWFYLGVGALLAGLGLTMGQALAPRLFELSPPRDKELGVMLGVKGTTIEKTIWTPISRIDVTRNDEVSLLKFPHPPGSFMVITQDATANTRLLSKRAIDEMATRLAAGQDVDTRSLVYRIKTRPKVAIIGVGGGMDVADALAHGAQSVLGIELNPATYRLANEIYADYNGHLMQDPRVTFVNEEGRSALRRRAQRFDVIQVIGIDTFAALSSGAYVLSENYLYTVEAFEDMFDRLEDGGILAFSRWLFHPPRESLRLSALACEAWKRRGQRDCESRIMVVGSTSWALSLFKNGRFTAEEASAVAEKARLIGQVVLHWPRVFPGSEQITWQSAQAPSLGSRYRQTSAIFGQLMASYAEGREREFMNSYRYNIRPTTDDSPFFFEYHYLNVLGLPDLSGGGWRAEASASMTLYMILIEATVVSLLAIFLPLWRRQRKGLAVSGAAAYSAYFAALGFGFMLVEISLTQRCVLFLGSPLYALPVVLASVLMSAGLGSRIVAWRAWDLRRVVLRVGPVLLVLLLTLVLCLTPMLRALLFLPFWLRVAVTVGLTASAGLLMGMFFPTGLRSVGQRASAFVPWAWGINGCTSVYGSIAAIMAAMASGFQATLTLGVLLYLVACLAGWRIERAGGAGVKTS